MSAHPAAVGSGMGTHTRRFCVQGQLTRRSGISSVLNGAGPPPGRRKTPLGRGGSMRIFRRAQSRTRRVRSPRPLECAAFLPYSGVRMPTLRLLMLYVFVASTLFAQTATEQKLADAIKSPQTTVVHLWAPWCSNCQAELKAGGWTKVINDNPQV